MIGNPRKCPKGIDIFVECVTGPSGAKGRKSRMRRLDTDFVPVDHIVLRDGECIILFEIWCNSFGKVSTVVSLDK